MDWSVGSKSILGKREGSILGGSAKRFQLDEDMDSVCSVDESIPQQDRVSFMFIAVMFLCLLLCCCYLISRLFSLIYRKGWKRTVEV